ncbi:hypothetical protein VNO78_08728 [Psophocarpus tetragonolobus]|uniref:Uncharacterized protein n=1 Tax=Psophocarpus tetragonolobus TaxID=3891 RepID=A0AAN9SWV4_PSOTE
MKWRKGYVEDTHKKTYDDEIWISLLMEPIDNTPSFIWDLAQGSLEDKIEPGLLTWLKWFYEMEGANCKTKSTRM